MMIRSFQQSTLTQSGRLLHAGGAMITLTGLALFVIFIYRPMQLEHQRIEEQTADCTLILNSADRIRYENIRLNSRLPDVERRLGIMMQRIPNSPRESDFLGQLTRLAERTQLNIRDYRPGVIVRKDTHSELEIKLSSVGSYAGICQFLDEVARIPRLCRVSGLEIRASNTSGEAYLIDMTFRIYFAAVLTPESSNVRQRNG